MSFLANRNLGMKLIDKLTTEEKLKIADKVVERLFIDAFGVEANRLVMESEIKLNGPGWGKMAVRNAVLRILDDLGQFINV